MVECSVDRTRRQVLGAEDETRVPDSDLEKLDSEEVAQSMDERKRRAERLVLGFLTTRCHQRSKTIKFDLARQGPYTVVMNHDSWMLMRWQQLLIDHRTCSACGYTTAVRFVAEV